MRRLFNSFVRSVVIGVGLCLGIMAVPSLYAATIGNCGPNSGPSGTGQSNACGFPADFQDINLLIGWLNQNITGYFTMNPTAAETGEVQFTNSLSFAANGSVATAMSSVGPTGSHTTIQRWLIIIGYDGVPGWIPIF